MEIDVRFTKDKKLAVSHDENAARVFGVDKNIGEMSGDEFAALRQKQTFQTLLEAYRKAKLAELDAYYDKLKRTDYTTDQWTKITEAYRTGRSSISSAQYAEQADATLKQTKADIDAYVNGDTIEVSFRLIGDFP